MIPEGFCQCGCGGKTRVATENDAKAGQVKGQPLKFLRFHHLPHRTGAENPRWNGGRNVGKYIYARAPGHPKASSRGYVLEHVLVAERALGHYLPAGAEIHHVDENPHNNDPSNLVICQDHSYHMLLHRNRRRVNGRFAAKGD